MSKSNKLKNELIILIHNIKCAEAIGNYEEVTRLQNFIFSAA